MKIVIFAGGFGTRMWPASRKSYPKQFYPILKGKSFFQITVERFKKQFSAKDIWVSTEHKYVEYVKKQAPEIPTGNIIAEPERRDNLGAIGLVASTIEALYPKTVIFFSWSDHFIDKEDIFLQAAKKASEYAEQTGRPVSIDQEPTFPSVHNGWLKLGKKVKEDGKFDLYEIVRHTEKPNLYTAKRFYRSKDYLIHTGYGAWRSDVLLDYYKEYAPQMYKGLEKISKRIGKSDYKSILKREYHKFEKTSVDLGLFEHIPSRQRLTIPVEMGWRDAGTWQLLYESLAKDSEENVLTGHGDIQTIDSEGNLVLVPEGKMVGLIGVSNLAIIDTPDGLLISSLDKTKKVKEMFQILEEKKSKYVE